MVKANRPGSQKAAANNIPAGKQQTQPAGTSSSAANASPKKSGKQSGKSCQPRIGGSAVPGAKSTQPKELSTASPANQQADYYNREMRRRMQQMGTGPYSDRAALDPRERRRKKRQEKLKERQERIKHLVEAKGPSRDIKLGRRNTYFLIGTVLFIVLLIVLFIIIRHPF